MNVSPRSRWRRFAVTPAGQENVLVVRGQRGENGATGGLADDAGPVELLADLDRTGSWTLLIGGVVQSHVDLGDPGHLELEYTRRIGHLIDLAAPPGQPLRVLHLGAGGLSLARYVAATRPGSGQVAVEADPRVAELVRGRLPLRRARPSQEAGPGRIRVRIGDARAVLELVRAGSFDVVIMDAFAGGQTPAHLTSAEFTEAVARALAPSGVYTANIADGPPLTHSRGRLAAIRAVFPCACVIAEASILRGRRFGNLVAAASRLQLPVSGLTRLTASDPFPARILDGLAVDRFIAGTRPITDATAEPSPLPPPEAFA